jgi:hypothetical protein
MGARSKRKGSKAERELARLFSHWWTGDPKWLKAEAKTLPIRPTPGSGGWAEGKGLKGDLVAVAKEVEDFGMLTIEIKCQESWSFDALLKTGDSKILKWWKQTLEEAAVNYGYPLLVFKKNLHPWYIMLNHTFADRLKLSRKFSTLHLAQMGVVVMYLNDFFSQVKRNNLIFLMDE